MKYFIFATILFFLCFFYRVTNAAPSGFPGSFQAGLTTGFLNIGGCQKQKTNGTAGFPGSFQAGLSVCYIGVGGVQKGEFVPPTPGGGVLEPIIWFDQN